MVPVRITIDRVGDLISVDVLDDSLAPERLIKAALKAVRKAAPFPAFSAELGDYSRQFDVRIIYKIQ